MVVHEDICSRNRFFVQSFVGVFANGSFDSNFVQNGRAVSLSTDGESLFPSVRARNVIGKGVKWTAIRAVETLCPPINLE